jgi:hypothetical protein
MNCPNLCESGDGVRAPFEDPRGEGHGIAFYSTGNALSDSNGGLFASSGGTARTRTVNGLEVVFLGGTDRR